MFDPAPFMIFSNIIHKPFKKNAIVTGEDADRERGMTCNKGGRLQHTGNRSGYMVMQSNHSEKLKNSPAVTESSCYVVV